MMIFGPFRPNVITYALVINFSLIFDNLPPPPPFLKNEDVIYEWPLTTHLGEQNTNCALSLEHFDSKSWCNLAHIKQSIDTSESMYVQAYKIILQYNGNNV